MTNEHSIRLEVLAALLLAAVLVGFLVAHFTVNQRHGHFTPGTGVHVPARESTTTLDLPLGGDR